MDDLHEQVLKAFVHGDGNLFNHHPELREALVWVYFHSNIPEFNKVECWGPLEEAAAPTSGVHKEEIQPNPSSNWELLPEPCQEDCECCFPPFTLIARSQEFPCPSELGFGTQTQQSFQQKTRES